MEKSATSNMVTLKRKSRDVETQILEGLCYGEQPKSFHRWKKQTNFSF